MAEQKSNGVSGLDRKKKNTAIYEVRRIQVVDEINDCKLIPINHFKWTAKYQPEAFGRMGLMEKYGLIISMTVLETNPLRIYKREDDPVYKDSAVEAFINLAPELDTRYCNFEMNANGTMLCGFGPSKHRQRMKELTKYKAICTSSIKEDSWSVLLQIPMELICDLYPIKPLARGDSFTCNFYKISEDPMWEHYASYSPIDSDTPNFHLPEYFGKAVII